MMSKLRGEISRGRALRGSALAGENSCPGGWASVLVNCRDWRFTGVKWTHGRNFQRRLPHARDQRARKGDIEPRNRIQDRSEERKHSRVPSIGPGDHSSRLLASSRDMPGNMGRRFIQWPLQHLGLVRGSREMTVDTFVRSPNFLDPPLPHLQVGRYVPACTTKEEQP
jgi:hypothetical protein